MATISAPRLPPAPARFSTITAWPPTLAQALAEQAPHHVGAAAGPERHHQLHRPGRPGRGLAPSGQGGAGTGQQAAAVCVEGRSCDFGSLHHEQDSGAWRLPMQRGDAGFHAATDVTGHAVAPHRHHVAAHRDFRRSLHSPIPGPWSGQGSASRSVAMAASLAVSGCAGPGGTTGARNFTFGASTPGTGSSAAARVAPGRGQRDAARSICLLCKLI